MPHSEQNHFKGKTVPEHLKEARIRGAKAAAEIHGTEISGKASAFADTLKDTSLTSAILWCILSPLLPQKQLLLFFGFFLLAWTLWKTARSAFLGWARLQRLHRLIEEEKWEIEHHREQEREELMVMYQAKGFEGDLLSQVIDVLMADDNRLLEVMLEEELGVPLEAYEHPLQQASGAFFGVLLTAILGVVGYFFFSFYGVFSLLTLVFLVASIYTIKIEKISLIPSLLWNLSVFGSCIGVIYFIKQLFYP